MRAQRPNTPQVNNPPGNNPQGNQPTQRKEGILKENETRRQMRDEKVRQMLEEVMPIVREARQFSLDVYAKKSEASKEDSKSPLVGELSHLSDQLVKLGKTLDTQSSTIRQGMSDEMEKIRSNIDLLSKTSKEILDLAPKYREILNRYKAEAWTGASPEMRSEREQVLGNALERLRPRVEEALSIKSENKPVQEKQELLRKLWGGCQSTFKKQDFKPCDELIGAVEQTTPVVFKLEAKWQEFERNLASHNQIFGYLNNLKTNHPKPLEFKQQSLATKAEAKLLAKDQANWELANQKLGEAVALAKSALPDNGSACLTFEKDWQELQQLIARALDTKSDCPALQDELELLVQYRDEITNAAKAFDYEQAQYVMSLANSRAGSILRDHQRWEEWKQAGKQHQSLFKAIEKIKSTSSTEPSLIGFQKAFEASNKFATAGQFSSAMTSLNLAISQGQELLKKALGPVGEKYIREFDLCSEQINKAMAVVPKYQEVRTAKDELVAALKEVESAADQKDYSYALQMVDVTNSRAWTLLEVAKQQQLFEQATVNYKKLESEALKVDDNLPGVSRLVVQLKQEWQAVQNASNQKLTTAIQLLKTAVRTASTIVGIGRTRQRQNDVHLLLKPTLETVQKTYIPNGTAQNYQRLQGQQEYDLFLKALANFEKKRDQPQALYAVNQAANAYLAVHKALPQDVQRKSPARERQETCVLTIQQMAHLKLAAEFNKIGPPPWNPEQENRIGQVRAEVAFEDGCLKGEAEKKQGVNGSYWINSVEWGESPEQNKQKKQLLFKPISDESTIAGFPTGGAAVREVMGKRINETLIAATGLSFDVPDTYLISVNGDRIEGKEGQGTQTGSAQVFAPSRGSLLSFMEKDAEFMKKVSKKSGQKMAMLDLVMVQTDRNSGNFMVGEPDETGNPTLIPIDHGLILPPPEGIVKRAQRGFIKGNMILDLPSADEKFDDEFQSYIELLDPQEIEYNLQQERLALGKQNPNLDLSTLLSDEAILSSKRSTQFLKYAAKDLTIKEIFQTLAAENVSLLNCSDQDMSTVFAEAVKKAKNRTKALEEVNAMSPAMLVDFEQKLVGLGWCQFGGMTAFEEWLETFAEDALRWYKLGLENPRLRKELDQTLNALGNPPELLKQLERLTLVQKIEHVRKVMEEYIPAVDEPTK